MTPASWTDRWQDRFDIAATVRGAALYRAGAVRLVPATVGWHAIVTDRRGWDCHADAQVIGCTCMIRQDIGPCAHLWAMLLAIDDLPPEGEPTA